MAYIEYFYAAHSAYAYLGSKALQNIAAAAGRNIRHRPYDLRLGIAGIGSPDFKTRPQNHRAYYFGREMERWAEERGIPMIPAPTHHSNDITLPNCFLIAADNAGCDVDALSHALLHAHWVDDADLADTTTLATLAHNLKMDADDLLARATSEKVLAQYEANTAEAVERSVFGSPTYFVDGDMFYEQDRLHMVERALKQPYKSTWPA